MNQTVLNGVKLHNHAKNTVVKRMKSGVKFLIGASPKMMTAALMENMTAMVCVSQTMNIAVHIQTRNGARSYKVAKILTTVAHQERLNVNSLLMMNVTMKKNAVRIIGANIPKAVQKMHKNAVRQWLIKMVVNIPYFEVILPYIRCLPNLGYILLNKLNLHQIRSALQLFLLSL